MAGASPGHPCQRKNTGDTHTVIFVDAGMVGCGAFDVDALEKFGYPAARVKPAGSASSIETIEDLLRGEIKGANRYARERGVAVGMNGREALDRL